MRNWETQTLVNWIFGTDEGMYQQAVAIAEDCDLDVATTADTIAEWIQGMKPSLESFWGEFIDGCLSEVDWSNVAEGAIEL
jgi:hypothetical protein